jgi:hypothetical protein
VRKNRDNFHFCCSRRRKKKEEEEDEEEEEEEEEEFVFERPPNSPQSLGAFHIWADKCELNLNADADADADADDGGW